MLARRSRWQDLFDMEREANDLFRRLFGTKCVPTALVQDDGVRSVWAPKVDVFARDGSLFVRAELPGVDPEKDIDISVEEGVLSIKGERRNEQKTDGEGFYRLETSYGAFERHVPLPQGVNADDITASYENGMLEVVVPKAAEVASAKRIPGAPGGHEKALSAKGQKK